MVLRLADALDIDARNLIAPLCRPRAKPKRNEHPLR
jgi:hypothetical protein